MKKFFITLGIVIASFFVLFLVLRIGWSFRDKKVLNVYILDKTVNSLDRLEHKSFTWILNNSRYVMPNKSSYSHKRDYYGFFPVDIENEIFDFKSVRINEVDAYAAAYDVAYFTDCYGVHSFEWYKGKTKPIRSQKVYGGLNQNDYLLMKGMLDGGKLVLAEYNMFSTPTNALVRNKTEELLGINWSGWSGRYYSTLDINSPDGPPPWMKNLFESQHMGVWPIMETGIVLINNDGLIEVLILNTHLNSAIPKISATNEAKTRFGVHQNLPFEQWFEFISPGKNHVHASFILDVNEKGLESLHRIGLSNEFAAVIEGSGDEKFFYFCGDFAENPAQMWTAKFFGGKAINHFLYKFNSTNRINFFTNFYTPLINSILEEYYQTLER